MQQAVAVHSDVTSSGTWQRNQRPQHAVVASGQSLVRRPTLRARRDDRLILLQSADIQTQMNGARTERFRRLQGNVAPPNDVFGS